MNPRDMLHNVVNRLLSEGQPAIAGRTHSLPTIGPNEIAVNVAPIGEKPLWEVRPKPADWDRTTDEILRDQERIFGLTWEQIQAKQQRRG